MVKDNKNKRKLRYGEIVDSVFEGLADFMIDNWQWQPDVCQLPASLGHLIKYIIEVKRKKFSEKKIRLAIKSLEKRNVLKIKEESGKAYVYLQEKGKIKVISYSLKLLLDFKKKKKDWDGKWFIVFFDVPEKQRTKRDYLRKFLRRLGFYPYQQSVYIFPYECEEEVKLIKQIVEGAKYIRYIVAEKIEEEENIKSFFNL